MVPGRVEVGGGGVWFLQCGQQPIAHVWLGGGASGTGHGAVYRRSGNCVHLTF